MTYHDALARVLDFHEHSAELQSLLLRSGARVSESLLDNGGDDLWSQPVAVSILSETESSLGTRLPAVRHDSEDSLNTLLLGHSIRVQTPLFPETSQHAPPANGAHSSPGSFKYGRKNGSVSDAVFADWEMTSL